MALSVTPQASPISNKLIREDSLSNVPVINAAGAPTNVFYIEIDNTMNPLDQVYVKLYDTATVQASVTQPHAEIFCPAGQRITVSLLPAGLAFANALSFVCSLDHGTPCGIPPVNPITVYMICS